MKNLLIIYSVLFSCCCFSITPDEIIRIAVERSSSLAAQEMEGHALSSEANLKGKWQNPQILGQFGTLKSGNIQGPTVEVSFTQPIPLSDKISIRKELATMAVRQNRIQSDFFMNWVGHQAILSVWKVYVAGELLKHGIERTKRIKLVKAYLETRPKVTIKQRVELAILSSTLVQLERMQDLKKHDYLVSLSDMEFWLGKKITDAENPFQLPDQYFFNDGINIDTSNDIELALAKVTVKQSQLDHELALKERRPDLFLGAGYRVENVTPENHFSYAILGLNIPIWDTGSSRIETAKVRERRDQKNFEDTERRLTLKHQKQIELLKFSLEQLKRFPKKFVAMNEAAIKEAELGFKQSLLDVNTFLLSETQSHEVIDQVFLSWMNYLENLSSLQLMKNEGFNWGVKN